MRRRSIVLLSHVSYPCISILVVLSLTLVLFPGSSLSADLASFHAAHPKIPHYPPVALCRPKSISWTRSDRWRLPVHLPTSSACRLVAHIAGPLIRGLAMRIGYYRRLYYYPAAVRRLRLWIQIVLWSFCAASCSRPISSNAT